MRNFLILILFLFSTVTSIAESQGGRQIADYDIKGFRIGDSLLDTYSEREIKNNRKDWYDDFGTYTVSTFQDGWSSGKEFQFVYKINDKKYIIQAIDWAEWPINIKKCRKKLANEEKKLRKVFPNATEKSYGPKVTWGDPTEKSKHEGISFFLKSDDVVDIQCMNWSNHMEISKNFRDNYRISIWEKEANKWYEENTN